MEGVKNCERQIDGHLFLDNKFVYIMHHKKVTRARKKKFVYIITKGRVPTPRFISGHKLKQGASARRTLVGPDLDHIF
jgi:hypothetical protein